MRGISFTACYLCSALFVLTCQTAFCLSATCQRSLEGTISRSYRHIAFPYLRGPPHAPTTPARRQHTATLLASRPLPAPHPPHGGFAVMKTTGFGNTRADAVTLSCLRSKPLAAAASYLTSPMQWTAKGLLFQFYTMFAHVTHAFAFTLGTFTPSTGCKTWHTLFVLLSLILVLSNCAPPCTYLTYKNWWFPTPASQLFCLLSSVHRRSFAVKRQCAGPVLAGATPSTCHISTGHSHVGAAVQEDAASSTTAAFRRC